MNSNSGGSGSVLDSNAVFNSTSTAATLDNYHTYERFLNDTLAMHGFPAPIQFSAHDPNKTGGVEGDAVAEDSYMSPADKVVCINALRELLATHRQLLGEREKVQERLSVLEDDRVTKDRTIERLRDKVSKKDGQIKDLEMRLRRVEKQMKKTEREFKRHMAEQKKEVARVINLEKKYRADVQRERLEYEKLQKHLQRDLKSATRGAGARKGRGSSGPPTAQVLNAANPKKAAGRGGPRGQPSGRKPETEDPYLVSQRLVRREEELEQLKRENVDIRASYTAMAEKLDLLLQNTGLKDLLEKPTDVEMIEEEIEVALSEFKPEQISSMPFEFAQASIERGLAAQIELLHATAQDIKSRKGEEASVSMEVLKKMVREQRAVIVKQDIILQKYLHVDGSSSNAAAGAEPGLASPGERAEIERERQAVEARKRELRKSELMLEQDRERFERERKRAALASASLPDDGSASKNLADEFEDVEIPPTPAKLKAAVDADRGQE